MLLKREHIMAKVILYIIFTFIAAFGLSGINFSNFFKKDKIIESRVLIITLSLSLGYLLTNFVIEFLDLTRIF